MDHTFKLEIDCENAAFVFPDEDYPTLSSASPELARILRQVADRLDQGCISNKPSNIRDVNGNVVGTFTFKNRPGVGKYGN